METLCKKITSKKNYIYRVNTHSYYYTMKPKIKLKSPIDSIIVDLIIDYYNVQNFSGKKEMLSGETFDAICEQAKKIYYKQIMITEEPGVA